LWSSIFWYEELALDTGWTFGDEMSRLGLEVVEAITSSFISATIIHYPCLPAAILTFVLEKHLPLISLVCIDSSGIWIMHLVQKQQSQSTEGRLTSQGRI